MRNLIKEIRIFITDGNIDNAVGLLEQGAPMVIEHFVIATQMKLYDILDLFLSRGWDIKNRYHFWHSGGDKAAITVSGCKIG